MKEIIYTFDWNILYYIKSLECGFMDFLTPKITMLGSWGIIWIIFSFMLILSKNYKKYGILMLTAMLIGVIIGNLMLKNIVVRSRPCWLESVKLLVNNPSDFSFPSGHTLASVIGAFFMTAANGKFGLFAIPLAVLIAFSRIYLWVHFPTDVLAAIILGIVISVFVLRSKIFTFKFFNSN